MFCINCGKQLEDGSRFCPYCGAKVPETGSSPQPSAPGGAGAPADNPFAGQGGVWQQPGPGADPGDAANPFQQPGQNFDQQPGENGNPNHGGGYQRPDQANYGGGYQPQPGQGGPQAGTAGGFDPWAVGGNSRRPGPGDDPWGVRGGGAPPAAPKKKKHTLRNVLLIVLGVIVLALIGLYILGSTVMGKYKPVIDSYLSYAEDADVQRVESLFYPEIVDNYHMIFGDTETIYYLDSWTDNYGVSVDRYEIAEVDEEEDELKYFNDQYGLQATSYVDVTADVYYDNGRYTCMDFDMVQIDGSWYLVYIW